MIERKKRIMAMQKTDSNLFDGQWELCSYSTSTGVKNPSQKDIGSKNYVKLTPGNRYNLTRTDTASFYMLAFAYKEDKSFSRYLGAKSVMPAVYVLNSDEYYMTFYLWDRTTPLENLRIELAE